MPRAPSPTPLFVSEADLARQHGLTGAEWAARAIILEREGFPHRDPITGLRYARAVQAFWDRRYGLSTAEPIALDGKENLDAL